jgi:mannose-1-phosphate guanylyltransferase
MAWDPTAAEIAASPPTRSAGATFWSVVPAGGSGTRLWPVSRANQPKFLLPLLGDRSLLQQTADRLGDLASPERTIVVCGPAHAAPVARQLPDLPEANVVVEPSPKGTCAAIALAAALIARREPNAIMGSFAADHDVRDRPAFVRAVRAAVDAAAAGWLVTVGLNPTRPETGYGYVERTDDAVLDAPTGRVFRAARFVEKPDRARAEEFVVSGRFLWNASMFVWRVRTFLDELERLQPALAAGIARIADAWDAPRRDAIAAEVWAGLPATSIDEGVMELSERVAVVPAAMGWSDVGDWHGLGDLLVRDAAGNSVRADVVQTGATNNVVWSGTGRVIALVGLDNLVVVDAPDALLIADRAQAQEVRRIVGLLKDGDRADRL